MRFSKILFVTAALCVMILSCGNGNNNSDAATENTEATTTAETPQTIAETPSTIVTTPAERLPEEDLSGNVQVLTEEEFAKKITEFDSEKGFQYKGKTPCIVDFYADWCRPCVALNPILIELAEKYKGELIIYKVNVDRAQRIAAAFQITSIPTLMFFKPDTQPGMMVGAPTKEQLDETIQDFLQE